MSSPVFGEQVEGGHRGHLGFGWDDGLGARLMFDSTWGMGLQVRPVYTQYESRYDAYRDYDSVIVPDLSPVPIKREDQSYTIAAMIFRETMFGRVVGGGPFVQFRYKYSKGTRIQSRFDYSMTSRTNTVSFEFGIRPVFRVHRRMILETRVLLGVSYARTRTTARQIVDEGDELVSTSSRSRWEIYAFGQNLGPGAVVSFIIFF